MENCIIIYREKGALACEQKCIGPFPSHDEAYDFFCDFFAKEGALGKQYEHRYIEPLISPLDGMRMAGGEG